MEARQKAAGVESSCRRPAGEQRCPAQLGAAIPCVTGEPLPAAEEFTALGCSIGEGLGRDQLKHGTRCMEERGRNVTLTVLPSLPPHPSISQEILPPPVPRPTPYLDVELLFEAAILGELAEGLEPHHLWKFTADRPWRQRCGMEAGLDAPRRWDFSGGGPWMQGKSKLYAPTWRSQPWAVTAPNSRHHIPFPSNPLRVSLCPSALFHTVIFPMTETQTSCFQDLVLLLLVLVGFKKEKKGK